MPAVTGINDGFDALKAELQTGDGHNNDLCRQSFEAPQIRQFIIDNGLL